MITVECPRCGQHWYSGERVRGRERLCEKCQDYFRRKRGGREPFTVTPFMIGVLVLIGIDAILIGLVCLWPNVFASVAEGYGIILMLIAGVMVRASLIRGTAWDEVDTVPWGAILIALAGLASLTAGLTIPKKLSKPAAAHKNEKPDSSRGAPEGRPGGGPGPGPAAPAAPPDAPANDHSPSR